jgi:hypothetical protein
MRCRLSALIELVVAMPLKIEEPDTDEHSGLRLKMRSNATSVTFPLTDTLPVIDPV